MSESRDLKSRRPLFGIRLWSLIIPILAIGVGLSFIAYRYGVDWEHSTLDASFRLAAATMGERLEREMQANNDVVLALRAFFEGSKDVTFDEFRLFTRDLLKRYKDIQALEWVPRVTDSDRPLFVAEARRLAGSQFQITERSAEGKLVKAGRRKEYFPVFYVEPLEANRAVLGFDLASNQTRMMALNQAAQSGQGVASGRIRLVQEAEEGYGFLFFWPVYAGQAIPASKERRKSQLRGFALGVFHLPRLVSAAIPHYRETGIDLFLFDITEKNSKTAFLFGHCPAAPDKHEPDHAECVKQASLTDYAYQRDFSFGGRSWQVLLVATPQFMQGSLTYLPHTILAAGLLATLLSLILVVNSARAGKELYEKNIALSNEIAERLRAESREALFKYTVSQMRDAAYWMNIDGRFVYVNDSACTALGYTREELLDMSVPDIDPKMPADKWPRHWHELKQAGHMTMEMLHRRIDGGVFPVELSLNYVEFKGEAFICAFARDITERKRVENALKERDELIRNVSEIAKVGGWEFDIQTGEGMWTDTVARIHDMTPEDETNKFIGLSFYEGEHLRRIENALEKAVEHGTPFDVELELVTRIGNRKWIRSMGWPVKEGDKIVKLRGSVQDITGLKVADEKLRQSEERYRLLFDQSETLISVYDRQGACLMMNLKVAGLFNGSPEDFVGKTISDLHPDDVEEYLARIEEVIAAGEPRTYEDIVKFPEGERALLSTVYPLRNAEGTVYAAQIMSRDITERKQAEDALRKSEKEYRRLVENMNDGLCTADANGVMTFVNRRVCEIFGYSQEEIIGSRVTDFLDEENAAEFNRQMVFREKGSSNTYELSVTGKDGRKMPVLISPAPIIDESGEFQGSLAVVTDIGELKQAQEALQEKQRQLATLMSNLPGMAYHGKNKINWPLDFISQGCHELTGYSSSELTSPESPQYGDLIHPDDRRHVWDAVQHSLLTGEPFVLEYRIRDKQGRERWVWEHGMGVGQDADGIDLMEGFIYDITKRKLADDAIKESENRFRSITENAVDYIFIKDRKRKYTFANQAMQKLLGLDRSEIIGKTAEEIFGPGQGRIIKEIDDRAFSGEIVNETRALTINGAELYFNTIQTPLTMEKGEAATIMGVVRDITEIKNAEKTLRKNEELLSKQLAEINHIYQTSPIGLAFMDTQLRFVRINQTLAEIDGAPVEEHLGKTIGEVLPDLASTLEPLYEWVVQSGEAVTNQAIHGTTPADPDSERDWLINYYPIKTPDGSIMGVGTVVQDITELKQAERALENLNEALEERVEQRTAALEAANRELESFAYSVSHDLRAPLRALDGFSQAILEDYREKLDDNGKDYLRRIRAASQRMGRLIDDILRLSRLSRTEMIPREVDLSRMAVDIVDQFQEQEPAREVEFSVQPDIKVWGDEDLLRVLMENLLGNAWKFTSTQPVASIEFGAMEHGAKAGGHGPAKRVYYIKDNGVGFNPDRKDKIFQVFQRLHTNEEFPGTGIGLATVQRVINRHSGEVWAESEEGIGAAFYFTLNGSKP